MRKFAPILRLWVPVLALAPMLALAPRASADVSKTSQITFDMGIMKIQSTINEQLSGDKRREDTDAHCQGFLVSMICGDMRGGDIVRLDKSVKWQLDPKKRSYVETPFPTPQQIAAVKAQQSAILEKLKSCPMPAAQNNAPDARKCQMSPPKFDIENTAETATIAGHQTRHSWIEMRQRCENQDTGDSSTKDCDFIIHIDLWLTSDQIPGVDEERAFTIDYDRKMGLAQATVTSVAPQLKQFLAPYADALKQAGAKAGDLKGYPLKTTISIGFGGEHCAAAHRAQQSSGSTTAAAGNAAENAAENSTTAATGAAAEQGVEHSTGGSLMGSIAGSAVGAFSRTFMSGMFAKKKTTATKPSAAPTTAGGGMAPIVSITTETTMISSDPIASDRFEIPTGWTRSLPKPVRQGKEPSCPQVGSQAGT